MTVALSGMTLLTNNDNEAGWAGTDGPDTYFVSIQGSNAESWNVAKNNSETGTLTKSASLPTSRGLFIFWMKSDLSYYYTSITTELQSSTNNFKSFTCATAANPAISGDFKASALDYVNKGTDTGTLNPASLATTRIIVDNSSSGNIRAVINNWIDAMYYGVGHTISGTTTGDALFTEAAAIDENVSNRYGILENYSGVIYSQGDLTLSGTALVSSGESLVFKDTLNGYDTYQLDITGTVTFTNTNISTSGSIAFDLDATGAAAFSMTGGALTGSGATDLIDGQTFNAVVCTNRGVFTIANDPVGCAFNTCGTLAISSTGSLTGCDINTSASSTAVTISSLDRLTDCTFVSDGTGHAVDLGTIAATTAMNWNNSDSSYASTDGSTGNETILVSVASGQTLTINVGAGYSTPTVYNTGTGSVSVVSGQVTTLFTVKDISTGSAVVGARVYLYAAAGGPLSEGTVIFNTLTDSNGQVSDTRSLASDQPVLGWVRKQTNSPYYQQSAISATIDNGVGLTQTIQLIRDE